MGKGEGIGRLYEERVDGEEKGGGERGEERWSSMMKHLQKNLV
jgi:hypothetical protein